MILKVLDAARNKSKSDELEESAAAGGGQLGEECFEVKKLLEGVRCACMNEGLALKEDIQSIDPSW
jgi:hypothetical protein